MDPSTPSPSTTSRPTRLLIATAAIALVVGLLVGAVVGWQVEKRRVEDDVDRLRDKIEELRGKSLGVPSPLGDAGNARVVPVTHSGENALLVSVDGRLVLSLPPRTRA